MIQHHAIRVLTDLSACRYENGPPSTIRAMHVLISDDDPETESAQNARGWRPAAWEGQIDSHTALGIALFP